MVLSLITLVFLFQNCGNINLLNSPSEDPPPESPQPHTPGDKEVAGDPIVYDCIENQTVPEGHDGLTMANRMTIGFDHSGHRYPTFGTSIFDLTQYNSIVRFPTAAAGPAEEGYGFPGSADMRTQLNVEPGKFFALKFRVPMDSSFYGRFGSLSFLPAHPTPNNPENYVGTNAGVSWSISKCPGQFRNVAAAPAMRSDDCSHRSGDHTSVEARIMWIIEDPTRPYQRPETSFQDRCPLTPGETYYLNVIPRVDAKTQGSLNPAAVAANYYYDLSDAPEDPNYPGYVPPFYSIRFMNNATSTDQDYLSGD